MTLLGPPRAMNGAMYFPSLPCSRSSVFSQPYMGPDTTGLSEYLLTRAPCHILPLDPLAQITMPHQDMAANNQPECCAPTCSESLAEELDRWTARRCSRKTSRSQA